MRQFKHISYILILLCTVAHSFYITIIRCITYKFAYGSQYLYIMVGLICKFPLEVTSH